MMQTEEDLDRAIKRLESLGIGVPAAQRKSAHDLAEQEVEEASLRVALARSQYEISMPRADLVTPTQPSKAVKRRSAINRAVDTCGKEPSPVIPVPNPAVEICGKGSSPATPAPVMGRTLAGQPRASNNPVPPPTPAPQPIRPPPVIPADGGPSGTSNKKYYAVTIGRCIGVYDNWYVFLDLSICLISLTSYLQAHRQTSCERYQRE